MKIKLVSNWRHLWKATSMQVLALGALLPEIMQLISDNTSLLFWLEDNHKSGIRLVCMLLAIVLRPVKQTSVSGNAP